ncbi:MAG: cell division ATP-binding protein FtsE [Clostridia bacterium]|nr:cell division ATP-binding protein FtsE [Clostridia bacterium]MDD4386199.1 cell division ATP-binding protein FtsE [Clostridia bacterium]
MIEFINVSKKYNHDVAALEDINIKIEKGEFVFLVGPSGSGKSTFLKLMVKEDDATTGTVIVNNTNVNKLKEKDIPFLRRKIGFVFQDFRLLYDRTVAENIIFALRVVEASEKDIKFQLKSVLELVGLDGKENCYPNQLSGGEQQRISLARALATRPPIIIADEPTGNLDPKTANEIFKTLLDINARGTTVLVVTHAKDIVDGLNKRVIALDNGKVVRDDARGGYLK